MIQKMVFGFNGNQARTGSWRAARQARMLYACKLDIRATLSAAFAVASRYCPCAPQMSKMWTRPHKHAAFNCFSPSPSEANRNIKAESHRQICRQLCALTFKRGQSPSEVRDSVLHENRGCEDWRELSRKKSLNSVYAACNWML